jgi:hypothetical protein
MLARLGEQAEAVQAFETLEKQRVTRQFVPPYYAAVALCGLDRIDEALDELELIRPDASTTGVLLGVDPLLDPLRGEDRFDAVLDRVNLAGLAQDSVRRRLLIDRS